MDKKEVIKQDINFLEYGLWVPVKGRNNTVTIIDKEGYTLESVRGIPTKVDILCLYYLLLNSQEHGYSENVRTTFYQICKGTDIQLTKATKQRLIEALELWKRVTVTFKGTFYDGKTYNRLVFGIIETIKVSDDKRYVDIRFNKEWLLKIKESNFFKYISFNEMKHLRSPVAIRLYEILCKSFYKRNEWKIGVQKLKDKIPLQEQYYSHIKKKIISSVNIINNKTSLNISVDIQKKGKNDGVCVFKKHEKHLKQFMDEEREVYKRETNIPEKSIDERISDIVVDMNEEEITVLKENFYDEIVVNNSFLKKRYDKNGYENHTVKENYYHFLKNKMELSTEKQ